VLLADDVVVLEADHPQVRLIADLAAGEALALDARRRKLGRAAAALAGRADPRRLQDDWLGPGGGGDGRRARPAGQQGDRRGQRRGQES
jgi:hypothetical protein